jgi:hypothetical protein
VFLGVSAIRVIPQALEANGRSTQREASRAHLQLLELGDVLIDALLPFLAQWFPDLRR